jgi:hypothetical protein
LDFSLDGVMRITGYRGLRLAAAAGLLLVLGCNSEDSRLKKLSPGITKDSAIALMGTAPSDNAPYLMHAQYIEALYYARPGKTDSASLALRRTAPIVTVNGKVTGWGWKYWDSVAAANGIKVPPPTK